MSTYIDSLLEKRANIWEGAKALLDTAAAEKRELSAEEEQSYARMTEDLATLRAQADKLTEDAASAKAAEESLRALASQRQERTGNVEARMSCVRS